MLGIFDAGVIGAYFALITWLGHRVSARQTSTREYFLGARSLPWWAVSASIVATTVSGVTFIGVPALVFAEGGDYRYLQFALAGIISKWIIGHWMLPKLYAGEFASPYELIRDRLGDGLGKLAGLLFFVGAVLGQGVRVFAVALVLQLLTGLPLGATIALVVVFSALHTWFGGIRAVVYTDVVQFGIFILGGSLAIGFASQGVPQGFSGLLAMGAEANKFQILDLSLDPALSFTLWAGIFAMPFQNLAAYGSDQINTQRMLCCRSLAEARRALYVSNLGELVVLLFLTVGLGLWGFYQYQPVDADFSALLEANADRIFPIFMLTELPPGLRGLLVAGVFAAAMSSLDSVLAALAQTSLTLFHRGYRFGAMADQHAVQWSRFLVLFWAVALGFFAWSLSGRGEGLVPLAFSMTAYTYGSLFGLLWLSLFVAPRRIHFPVLGVVISITAVTALSMTDAVAFPWLFPVGVVLSVGFALLPLKNPKS
jgi:SSS family solute:Na+ symporter